ncbi:MULTISPECIES: hypothetical protein [Nocardiopsis]|uniref:ATP/GTP-binding protein n=1 Tax=Nocardiopsis sinuspersici TaxID=501010 RepID=A0A1V3BYD4_9ACTN|nr:MULTISPECIES: hypothetical protein [Nocardiopsis]NYH54489.1 hypothetical protein [Nocardiopsis sinuspersici]OOC53269.1 hypothetical protein NOSIN_05090 [Nocardiopsis sinuspersici]
MLRPVRPAAAAAVLTLLAAGAATPAHADDGSFLGQVECGSSGGVGCSILLRWWKTHAGQQGSGGSGGGSGVPGVPAGSGDGVDWSQVDWDAIDWSQVDWDAIDWESIDYGGEGEGEAPTDPVTLIQEAMAAFELPPPRIGTSPGSDSLVLVNTPVWLWVDSQDWDTAETSAEVQDWSLTVTADPTSTVWNLGDGTQVRCEGPGTPFDPAVHDPASASPDCGHVYTLPSDSQEGGVYPVSVQVGWDVGWEFSDGEAGAFDPVTTTSQVELRVAESHGLVTD